jgi:hypothetical protein
VNLKNTLAETSGIMFGPVSGCMAQTGCHMNHPSHCPAREGGRYVSCQPVTGDGWRDHPVGRDRPILGLPHLGETPCTPSGSGAASSKVKVCALKHVLSPIKAYPTERTLLLLIMSKADFLSILHQPSVFLLCCLLMSFLCNIISY